MARRAGRILPAFLGLVALAWPGAARAQQAAVASLDRLDPAPAGDAFFTVPSAEIQGNLRPAVSLLGSYARDPLVLRTTGGGASKEVEWVNRQALFHALVSLELFKRVKLELDLPATVAQGGRYGTLGDVTVKPPSGANLGDIRAGLRVVLLHQQGWAPAASIAFSAWFPTGDATQFTSSGTMRYAPAVIVGAEYRYLVWSVNLAQRFQPGDTQSLLGSQVAGGAGVAARWRVLQVGPEVFFNVGVGDPLNALAKNAAGGEALLTARATLGPVWLGAGGGLGFGRSPGTPSYRLFASLGAAFDVLPRSPFDEDDGEGAKKDAGAKGAKGSPIAPPAAAPPLDRDGDGVPDAEDACPLVVGDPSPKARRRGCPPDRDGDGIVDADDRCPDEPGVASDVPAKNGCPADSDGDGIVDTQDACPYEKGKPSPDPKANGCPTSVRVEGTQIVILQQVNFETGRDVIKPDSFGLLQQVADVLKDHPDIARLAVDGHTDNVGAEKANLLLSQRRALSVVRWLTDHGVDARRLEARGFGPRRPVADNKTAEGKAKNRRVEFQIRRRTPEGEAGWRDGPID